MDGTAFDGDQKYPSITPPDPISPALQVRGTIQRIQLDDQMLMAAHPVVLAPSGVAHAQAEGSTVWRDLRLGGSVPVDRGSLPIIR